ncbi:hypothetical protein BbiDN127_NXAF0029 (plasmid) [Borreliella bissettiae DN127]|uniref:Uncharacterized protein n=1 Tax=Borrelia bissettiae (strain DSM 17990 / CIP 109136 / DN127) TaxID=521010 RepID=G0ANP3_BORBD|nr:hypothetical protein BbiDN127_NXAF0029 [Borreliella bissettiae DN127]
MLACKGYDHSIYAFIKRIIPIGRVLKINNKDGIIIEASLSKE